MAIDDRVLAIDTHTHPQTEEFLAAMGPHRAQMGKYFGKERQPISFAAQADLYRERRMMAVILNSDSETVSGVRGASNDLLGKAQADHPDVFIGFCGIDPWKGQAAIAEIRRCKDEFDIYGVGELNPARQRFKPNDRHFYPIWEVCAELGLVVTFHGGIPGRRRRDARGHGAQARLRPRRPVPRRRRRGLPGAEDHLRASRLAVAPRGARGLLAQVELLHRPVGVGAEVPAARGRPLRRTRSSRTGSCSGPTGLPSTSIAR